MYTCESTAQVEQPAQAAALLLHLWDIYRYSAKRFVINQPHVILLFFALEKYLQISEKKIKHLHGKEECMDSNALKKDVKFPNIRTVNPGRRKYNWLFA